MTQERIDIEVTDKVDGNVEAKLRGIAAAADKGESSVARLKAQLASISSGPVQALKTAMSTVTATVNSELNATARLRQETARSSVEDLKAATAKERLAKASSNAAISAARQAAAESKASEAASRAALAALRLADAEDASAARKLKSAAASDAAAAAMDREAAASAKLATETAKRPIIIHDRNTVAPAVNSSLGGMAGSRSEAARQTGAMAIDPPKVKELANEIENFDQKLNKANNTAGRSRANMANLAAQFQDIGVSLAGGQNPLLVFIQQGSQISYIAGQMEGGMMGVARAAVAMIAPFLPLVIALGAAYVAFKQFGEESAGRHKKDLEEYAKTLGLTNKEMRKLANESVGANGKLKEFDAVTITNGDNFNGFIATVKEGLAALIEPFSGASGYFKSAWEGATNFALMAFKGFYASVNTLVKLVANSGANTAKIALNIVIGIAEGAVMAIQAGINGVITGINFLIDVANAASEKVGKGKLFDTVSKVDLGVKSIGQNMFELSRFDIAGTFNEELQSFDRTVSAFGKRWDENNVKAAKARIKALGEAIIQNRNPAAPKKEADPKTQNDFLNDENKKLDNQLSRMKMLKDAREEQQQLDQIEESFAKRRMPLTEMQIEGFRKRIHAIQEYKYQQAEMDRIYESATGPLRTYNAAVAASADLLARGAINQAQATEEVNRASRAYAEATNPLLQMQEAMTASERAATLYGRAAEQNSFYEQVRQAYLSKGIDITKNATAAQLEEVAALMKRNEELSKQTFVQQQVGQIVNPMIQQNQEVAAKADMYAEIERLRQTDVLSERQAQQAKMQLQNKFDALRLQGAQSFFENLSGLSQSKNSELAAIGKAAAVVDATIKGYQAVQNVLATIPPPFNIPAAAAMAATTGIQISNILSTPTNVGSFATGGQFMVQGEPGVDQNNISMNVSRGERVTIETTAQQRDRDARGNGPANIKIVNVTDKRDVHAAMESEEGEQVIFNAIRRNPKKVKALIGA